MSDRISPLLGDSTDRQLEMMQRWQDSIQQTQQMQRRPNEIKGDADADIRDKIRRGEIECPTCRDRQYVDQSDDAGVSFQTPTSISPGQSAAAVSAHEREHVMRNAAKAEAEDREVTHSSVAIFYDTCPDCGRQYASGGLTTTRTQARPDKQEQNFNPFAMLDKTI
ncbi:MAG: hypothetical protein FWG94_10195 [Oscillospiraceae bacterium]|nr:hypothetical protein [Oscillospiraceae bacterium]